MRLTVWAVVRALVVLGLAALLYAFTIPITHLDPTRLPKLVVHTTGVPGLKVKAKTETVLDPANQPFAAAKSAAAAFPDETGAYTIEWEGTKSTNTGVELLVERLPTLASAAKVESQADALYLTKTAFKSAGLTLKSTFTDPSIPGLKGAVFTKPATKSAAGEIEADSIFRVGKAVAIVILPQVLPESIPTQKSTLALSGRERTHLLALGPDFSLSVTSEPVLATSIFAVVALLLAVAAALGPPFVRRERERRRERQIAREREQYRVRGAKVLKRHAKRPLPNVHRRRTLVDWLTGR